MSHPTSPTPPLTLADAARKATRVACWPLYAAFWIVGAVLETVADFVYRK